MTPKLVLKEEVNVTFLIVPCLEPPTQATQPL